MKARVKATGEIGIVTRIDVLLKDDLASFSSNKVEILQNYADATIDPDYWTRLEHQYAGMAMQGLMSYVEQITPKKGRSFCDEIVDISFKVAHALVEKYKKEERK